MAKGTVNKIILLGRLGQAPEIRQLPNGNAVANISLATNDGYKDKQTGQYIDVTEWHRVVVFGKLAEVIQQYVHKGSQLFVEGRLRTNKWTDQHGQDRYTTEIVANEIQLMGGNTQGQSSPPVEAYAQNNIATPSHQPISQSQDTQERQEGQQNQKVSQSTINDYAKAKGERQSNGNHQPNLSGSNEMAAAMNDFDDDQIPF